MTNLTKDNGWHRIGNSSRSLRCEHCGGSPLRLYEDTENHMIACSDCAEDRAPDCQGQEPI